MIDRRGTELLGQHVSETDQVSPSYFPNWPITAPGEVSDQLLCGCAVEPESGCRHTGLFLSQPFRAESTQALACYNLRIEFLGKNA